MECNVIEKLLTDRGIKPTPNRILVLRQLMKETHPVNLADLETKLDSMDKSSIFRVLELFAGKDLVHVIEDGSRSSKYEVCHSRDHHDVSDEHAHFYCEKCGALFCLDDMTLPDVVIPEKFKVRSVNFILKGLCPDCNSGS